MAGINIRIEDRCDRMEFIGGFIDIFEDFLEERGITLDNDERQQDEDAAIIYGSDYGELFDRIDCLAEAWSDR